jgi:hypothetical protein
MGEQSRGVSAKDWREEQVKKVEAVTDASEVNEGARLQDFGGGESGVEDEKQDGCSGEGDKREADGIDDWVVGR